MTLTAIDELSSCFLILFSIFVFMLHRPALLVFGLVLATIGIYADMLIPSISFCFVIYAFIVLMSDVFDIYLILALVFQFISAIAFVVHVPPFARAVARGSVCVSRVHRRTRC